MIQSKLIMASILMVSLCLIAPLTAAADVEYCYGIIYNVKVKEAKVSPDPIPQGTPMNFTFSATTDDEISGAILRIEILLLGMEPPIQTTVLHLCKETSCPISGDFRVSHTQDLPPFIPQGPYVLRMTMYGADTVLTCITFDFTVGFPFAKS
ncbi:hypothetical protein M5689_015484 [Euphorbia peplus]|nr:hypothetical protein M5689_015484 [Euphorbia peplus]